MKSILWGQMPDGRDVTLYVLDKEGCLQTAITNYGATIVSSKVPDRAGKLDDIVIGYDDLGDYLTDVQCLGASIGRYANRIARGQFILDGHTYVLSRNERKNTLHGGVQGFNKTLWNARVPPGKGECVEFEYQSIDGEEGFPGNLSVTILCTISDAGELRIDYNATSDEKTVVNLANHSYFNLAGAGNGSVMRHELLINADHFLPCDEFLIPTGEMRPVRGTPFDFRSATLIGERLRHDDQQLNWAKGYDHTWILKHDNHEAIGLAARVHERRTGRVLEVFTTEPGIQFYSGNMLKGERGRAGHRYFPNDAFCLEAQHFPDSPNKRQFPSTVVAPRVPYVSTTIYRFSTKP